MIVIALSGKHNGGLFLNFLKIRITIYSDAHVCLTEIPMTRSLI